MCLAVLIGATSCEDKVVEYMYEDVNDKPLVQLYYVAPMSNVAANRIYYASINGEVYSNSGSALLSPYNFIPSGGVGLYYTLQTNSAAIELYDQDNVCVYSQTVTGLEGGKKYRIFVHDMAEAPVVAVVDDIPEFPGSADTGHNCSVIMYNFLYEEDGTPFQDKVQYALLNDSTDVYENVGNPAGFGESIGYITPEINKTIYNSSGYQRRYLTLYRIDATTGENLGQLEYTNASGRTVKFTDYWTWYIGRSYIEVLRGVRTSSSLTMAITQFTAL